MTAFPSFPHVPGAHRAHLLDPALLQEREEAADERAQVQALVRDAKERAAATADEAEELLQSARAQAEQIITAARERADTLLAEAAGTADAGEQRARLAEVRLGAAEQAAVEHGKALASLLDQARGASDELLERARATAREQADLITAQARGSAGVFQGQAEQLRAAAEGDAAGILRQAREAADGIRAAAEKYAEKVTGETGERAQRSAEEILAAARAEAEEVRAGITVQQQDIEERTRKVAAALAEAERDRKSAGDHQERAARLLDEAEKATSRREARALMVTKALPRVALWASIVLTASGEFALAQLVGWPNLLAWAYPLAIDCYVVAAFRRHRDVFPAVLLMIVANATVHLAEAGVFGTYEVARGGGVVHEPQWWLTAAVVGVVPLILWRIHALLGEAHTTDPDQGEQPVTTSGRAVPFGGDAPAATAPAGTASGEQPVSGAGSPWDSGPGNGIEAVNGAAYSTGSGIDPVPSPPGGPDGSGSGSTNAGSGKGGSGSAGSRSAAAGNGRRRRPQAFITTVRDQIGELIDAGQDPVLKDLAEQFNEDPEWIRNQIRAVRDAREGA